MDRGDINIMAGIGFSLKRFFDNELLTKNTGGYLYSSFVVAGPWIAAVITVNCLIFIGEYFNIEYIDRQLFMGTIVYSFVFSQLLTAPFQLLITRYISDKLYLKEYRTISASFSGMNILILSTSIAISIVYYWDKPIPLYYKIMSIALFSLISVIWITMVYLSAIKNYSIISKAYIYGGIISIGLAILTIYYPIFFKNHEGASNLLLSFLFGFCITYIILIFSLIKSFPYRNTLVFDFVRYFSKLYGLSLIGLLYTMGLWSHNIIMWYFSDIQEEVLQVYRFAPIYDYATFLAFLITIPTTIMFVVFVETDFYGYYRKFYNLVVSNGSLDQIKNAKEDMKRTLVHHMIFVFETQAIITITCIALSSKIFVYLNESMMVRNAFRIVALGAFLNTFVFLTILILLYFQANKRSTSLALIFCITNILFTIICLPLGIDYYGIGFFVSTCLSLIIGTGLALRYIDELEKITFLKQFITKPKESGLFYRLALILNGLTSGKVEAE